jgi:hypothetical protein
MVQRITCIVVAAAAVAAGCGAGDATAGMSGRQVVRGHDVSDVFFGDTHSVAFTRQTLDSSQSQPQDLWVVGLDGSDPQIALPGIDWAPPVSWVNLRIGELLETGLTGRLFYDFASRQRSDLGQFADVPPDGGTPVTTPAAPDGGAPDDGGAPPDGGTAVDGATPPPTWGDAGGPVASPDGGITLAPNSYWIATAIRRDGAQVALSGTGAFAMAGTLGVGPPADLHTFTFDGEIGGVDFIGTSSDLALLYVPPAASDPGAGVYRFSPDTGTLTELVPPSPIGEWGETLGGCLAFGAGPCDFFQVVGCGASDPVCPDSGVTPCAIVYVKGDPENPGQLATYAYDLNAGAGFKLPGMNASHLFVSPDRHLLLWDDSSFLSKRYWNLCTGKKDFCPDMAGSQLLWRPDWQGFVTLTNLGELAVASFADGVCSGAAVAENVYGAAFTAASDRLAWLGSSDAAGDGAGVWLAQQDGSAAVQVTTGTFAGLRFSPDGTKLALARTNTSRASLAWLDLTASPPALHSLVDDYGGLSRMGNRRVLVIDNWNSQDASGDLAVVDIVGGARKELGRAVTQFATSGGSIDDGGADLAYAVRSRVASDRDGLWLTTIPPP